MLNPAEHQLSNLLKINYLPCANFVNNSIPLAKVCEALLSPAHLPTEKFMLHDIKPVKWPSASIFNRTSWQMSVHEKIMFDAYIQRTSN